MASEQLSKPQDGNVTPKMVASPDRAGRPRECGCNRRICGAVALAALIVAFLLLQHFDLTLMRWRFVIFPKGVSGGPQQIVFGLRDFGQVLPHEGFATRQLYPCDSEAHGDFCDADNLFARHLLC